MEILFIIVAVAAIGSAVAMLLSENAVHSALFLILNFICVAFFYLMLDAPFLAMIQIAVYAGAIMVLFLFVIMLLGAEKLASPSRTFRWLAPLAIGLGMAFIIVTGITILQGQINIAGPLERQPMLRVVHSAAYVGPVDVYANGSPIATNLAYGDSTEFLEVPAGDYSVALHPAGAAEAALTTTISLPAASDRTANTYTAIAYGGAPRELPQVALIPDNVETVEARSTRITIFNGMAEPINLVDSGSEFDTADDRVVLAGIAPGTTAVLPAVAEDTDLRPWRFTPVGAEGVEASALPALTTLNNDDVFQATDGASQLLIVAEEALVDGATRVRALPLVTDAVAPFGGPHAIGQQLFTRYLLAFQLIAVLLLAAMVGAIVLTHKEDFQPRRRDVRRRVMKPLTAVIADQVGQDVTGTARPALPERQAEAEAVGD